MTEAATMDAYGTLTEPMTLTIQRRLPGPIERIWAYLTESELRRQWLAAGAMPGIPGGVFELVWHNDDLNDPPSRRPEGFPAEHRMQCRVIAAEPPHRLAFTWGTGSEVEFTLAPQGSDVLLTLVHRRVPDRGVLLNVGAGWHMHLDMLAARAEGRPPPAFWDGWLRLKAEYAQRLPD